MSKEEIFAIIDDELEKRKLNTFLLWDFPNAVKKRIDELYQSVDNAKPSEALKCIDVLKEDGCITTLYQGKALEIIKQALIKAQEQEKVLNEALKLNGEWAEELDDKNEILNIIKEKNVDIWLLKSCLTVEQYNFSITKMDNCNVFNLTKEEFELLKRWFNK